MQNALLFALVALLGLNGLSWFALYHLIRQRGRMLIRLDAIERRLRGIEHSIDEEGRFISPQAAGVEQVLALAHEAISPRADHSRDIARYHRSLSKSRILREGLKAGTPAPAFNLPAINGQSVSLDAYTGRRLLLMFTSPYCAPCDNLAPHLVRLQARLNGDLALLMIGRGEAGENRLKAEHYGFTFPVALQKHWEISKQYGIFATPVAFLIDEAGVIIQDVAKGVDEILTLAEEALYMQREAHHEPSI